MRRFHRQYIMIHLLSAQILAMTKVLLTLVAAKNYKIVSQASNICTWFLRDMVSQHWLY